MATIEVPKGSYQDIRTSPEAVDLTGERSLTEAVLCNGVTRTVAPLVGGLLGAVGGVTVTSPSIIGTPAGALLGAGAGAEATAASLRGYCDQASLPDALACNGFARATLPAIGGVVGATLIGGTSAPSVIGAVPAGAAGGAAGVAAVEAPLEVFCDGQIDSTKFGIKTLAGVAGGVAAGLVAGPAQGVAQTAFEATKSGTVYQVVKGVTIGGSAAATQNATAQVLEIGAGRRESFSVGEFGEATTLGALTGASIGIARAQANNRLCDAQDKVHQNYQSDAVARERANATWFRPQSSNPDTAPLGGLPINRWLTESDVPQMNASMGWIAGQQRALPRFSMEREAAGEFAATLSAAISHLESGAANGVFVRYSPTSSPLVTVRGTDGATWTWPRS